MTNDEKAMDEATWVIARVLVNSPMPHKLASDQSNAAMNRIKTIKKI